MMLKIREVCLFLEDALSVINIIFKFIFKYYRVEQSD